MSFIDLDTLFTDSVLKFKNGPNFGLTKLQNNLYSTEGRIYEYQYLYKKIPDDDSWFWKYYPR